MTGLVDEFDDFYWRHIDASNAGQQAVDAWCNVSTVEGSSQFLMQHATVAG